jgi:hypothetical protein
MRRRGGTRVGEVRRAEMQGRGGSQEQNWVAWGMAGCVPLDL